LLKGPELIIDNYPNKDITDIERTWMSPRQNALYLLKQAVKTDFPRES